MKKIVAIALPACVAVSLVVAPQSAHATPKASATSVESKALQKKASQKPYDQQERRILNEINAFRVKNGLKPLMYSYPLSDGARYWSHYMEAEGKLKHDPQPAFRENLYKTSRKPEDAVRDWIKSPGERANMLGAESTMGGVGVVKGKDGYWYVTARFTYTGMKRPGFSSASFTTLCS